MNNIRTKAMLVLGIALLTILAACGGTAPAVPLSISISAETESAESGAAVQLTATIAGDGAEAGNVTWAATGGSFSAITGTTVTWTAPDTAGTVTVAAQLTGPGDSVEDSLTITVSDKPIDEDDPDTDTDEPEKLRLSISAAADTALAGATVQLSAEFSGEGAEANHISWAASAGTFTSTSGDRVTWTAPATAGTVTIAANLDTGSDSVSDSLTITVTEPLAIVVTASPAAAHYGQVLPVEAAVTGPGAATATVNWTADSGTLSSTTGPTSTWTAPSSTGTATITASLDGADSHDSVVIPVRLCTSGDVDDAADPCIITNVHQLQALGQQPNGHFRLGSDIDASATAGWNDGAGFATISQIFGGVLDGADFTVSDLTINRPDSAGAGLFSSIGTSGLVSDLSFTDAQVTALSHIGILAGRNAGSIVAVNVAGTVNALLDTDDGHAVSGGLVGINTGTVTRAHSSADVTTQASQAGGLAGANISGGTIAFSGSSANTVDSGDATLAGGLVGFNNDSEITDSFSTSTVSGGNRTGGLAGQSQRSVIERSYVGTASTVTGKYGVGGLVGIVNGNSVIRDSYAVNASVTGENSVGGLIGQLYEYSSMDPPLVTRTYAVNEVTATAAGQVPGGLVAEVMGSPFFNSSYWENDIFGPPTSLLGHGRHITLMIHAANYSSWDFTDTWSISEGRSTPQLRSNPQQH